MRAILYDVGRGDAWLRFPNSTNSMRPAFSATRVKAVLAAVTLVFLATRCSDSGLTEPTPDTKIVNLTVDPLTATLRVGATLQLITVGKTAANTIGTTAITYTSTNSAVVTVTSGGLLKALTPGTATVTAAAGTVQVSATITVIPGLAASLTKVAGDVQNATTQTAVLASPSVVVKDSAGNLVSGATVTFTVQAGGGSITGATATSNASGVATAGTWTLGIVGLNSLLATVLPSVGTVTTSFSAIATAVPPLVPASVELVAGDAQSATIGTAVPIAPSVVVKTANGVPVPGTTVTFAITSGGGALTGATAVTNASGVATVGSWTLGLTIGAQLMTATVSGLTPRAFTATGTAVPLPATQLAVATAGGGASVGAPMTIPPVIEFRDQNGVLVSTATGVVTATISVGGRLTGNTTATAVNGVATFNNLIPLDPGNFTILFQSPGLASVTSAIHVTTSQPPVSLALAAAPSGGSIITPLTVQPVVELRDAGGLAAAGTNVVTVAVASGPGVLSGTATVTAVNGTAAFAGLSLSLGGTYTLVFTSPGLASVTSAPFVVATTPPSQMVVTTQPVGGTSGANLPTQPVLQLRDASGTVVAGATNSVTVGLVGSAGTLSGTTTVAGVNGIVTFTDLKITGVGSYQLTFTSGGIASTASTTITVTP